MNCPKCEKEMDAGYLQWRGGECITWTPQLLPMGISYWRPDTENIQSTTGFGVSAIPTHICKHCKLLLSDYSEK